MSASAIPVFKRQAATPPPATAEDRQRLVVVGSGPVGLAMALDLGLRGQRVVVVGAYDFIPHGSKAICFSKQSLDLFDRLGIGERVIAKGVIWNVGKVFWGASADPVYEFDMLPVKGQKNPGFVNIQQYYVEDYLVDAIARCDNVEIRWGHRVTGVTPHDDGCRLEVGTAAGAYAIAADYVLACDGSRSTVREALGLDFAGRVFEDNFLIADVRFRQQRPSERWFWFDPPFNPGRTALLHKQPDDVWRLDFQLGRDVDRDAAIEPAAVTPLVRGMLGDDVQFDYEWLSVYTFQCRRMQRFVHGRVVFVGDSAHLVSPFGARGCNGGLADVDNLGWKLDRILRGTAAHALLASYEQERIAGSDENILNSTRSTDFMVPRNAAARAYRDAVLELARDYPCARPFVNSGRLSTPTPYRDSPLSTPDTDAWDGGVRPGHPALDAPLDDDGRWLLDALDQDFSVLHFGPEPPATALPLLHLPATGGAAERYGAGPQATYLIRPDRVVAGRWHGVDGSGIEAACARAAGTAA